ncbi:hypothetical protein EPO05_00195 [Patescibacteria group bacterium]|nr:MAG: hypothetical protein EPO05_00195 [Patescibacteria group bacterium]
MILATHALTGAALGKFIPNPWILIPIAIAAHFAMDYLRHGEYVESFDSRTAFKNTWWKIALDILIAGVLIGLILYLESPPLPTVRNMLLGGFFSTFPDLLTVLFWKFKWSWLAPIYNFHAATMHRYPRFAPEREWNFRNSLNDILISLACLIFLFL